jgi:O-antigen/teichoic acid export membrane protein
MRLREQIRSLFQRNPIFVNSGFLIANSILGSFLGFIFWMLAARFFPTSAVGVGTAYFSTINLLSFLGDLGISVAVIRFAPGMKSKRDEFINSSFIFEILGTLFFIIVFSVGLNIFAPGLKAISASSFIFGIFIISSLLFSLAQFIDSLFVAFQTTQYLFFRNLTARILSVIFLLLFKNGNGINSIIFSVGLGILISFLISAFAFVPKAIRGFQFGLTFTWSLIWEKASYSLSNYFSLFMWNLPTLVYPLLIINLLGASANAFFYMSWMIANVLYIIPTSVSTSSLAEASNQATLDHQVIWKPMALTLIGLIPVVIGMIALSGPILNLFGRSYEAAGRILLIYLIIAVFPYTINSFLITYYRVILDTANLIIISSVISLLSLGFIVVLGLAYGLEGIGLGWLAAQTFGGIIALILSWNKVVFRKIA